ncbi:MAG TPA: transposase [Chloroflexota bacterium]|nr:transposase [Chloroflexota bacterium]
MWLITFSTYRRRPVFADPDLLLVCAEAIREVTERNGYCALALAVMPDHVHIVLNAGTSGHERSKVLNNLKGVSSRRVFLACQDLKLDLRSEHLWADEYQAAQLTTDAAVDSACRYVCANPGKFGLPEQQYAWLGRIGLAPYVAETRGRDLGHA